MPATDHHAHFVPQSYCRAVALIQPGDPWHAVASSFLARFGPEGSAPTAISALESRVEILDRADVGRAIEESAALSTVAGVAGFGITAHPAGRPLDDPMWQPLIECWSDLRA